MRVFIGFYFQTVVGCGLQLKLRCIFPLILHERIVKGASISILLISIIIIIHGSLSAYPIGSHNSFNLLWSGLCLALHHGCSNAGTHQNTRVFVSIWTAIVIIMLISLLLLVLLLITVQISIGTYGV